MASDDSVELKVGSSSHKAPEPLFSLEVCFDDCSVEKSVFLLQDSLSAGAERKLANVRQEEVFGSGTAKRHRRWKRSALRTK